MPSKANLRIFWSLNCCNFRTVKTVSKVFELPKIPKAINFEEVWDDVASRKVSRDNRSQDI